jgi:hypothetical protein
MIDSNPYFFSLGGSTVQPFARRHSAIAHCSLSSSFGGSIVQPRLRSSDSILSMNRVSAFTAICPLLLRRTWRPQLAERDCLKKRTRQRAFVGEPRGRSDFQVRISNSHYPTIQWLKSTVGGFEIEPRRKSDFLRLVAPYVRVKRDQVELLLTNAALISKKGPRTEEERRQLHWVAQRNRDFNEAT